MTEDKFICGFYFEDLTLNRKILFSKALSCAKNGKVLYILSKELTELPQLSQDMDQIERHYMKLISFLYAPNLQTFVESVVTIPTWQNIPHTIILEDLCEYCSKDNFQTACGIIALLIDTVTSCSKILKSTCRLYLSIRNDLFSKEKLNILRELYTTQIQHDDAP